MFFFLPTESGHHPTTDAKVQAERREKGETSYRDSLTDTERNRHTDVA